MYGTKSTHRSQGAKLEILPVHLRLNLCGKFELHNQNQTGFFSTVFEVSTCTGVGKGNLPNGSSDAIGS